MGQPSALSMRFEWESLQRRPWVFWKGQPSALSLSIVIPKPNAAEESSSPPLPVPSNCFVHADVQRPSSTHDACHEPGLISVPRALLSQIPQPPAASSLSVEKRRPSDSSLSIVIPKPNAAEESSSAPLAVPSKLLCTCRCSTTVQHPMLAMSQT
jgi:hypothetical protein